MNVENVLDEMLNDLNAANDEFINSYFDEENSERKTKIVDIMDESSREELIETIDDDNENYDKHEKYNYEEEIVSQENLQEIEESLENNEKKVEVPAPKLFSYNEILDRLDKKEKIDINNPNDILNLIDRSNDSEEFFNELEKVSKNDK